MPFGRSPFGRSAFASDFGESATDADGTITEAALFARLVGSDQRLDANRNLEDAIDPVDEEVARRLNTIQGTFIGDQKLGNSVQQIRILNSRTSVDVIDAVNRCLAEMVERGAIADLSTDSQPEVHSGCAWNVYAVSYKKTGLVER